ncbi:hypothetical protein MMC25_001529 [Agyrium rufum]|nr:hypothetical protein [Agyrium rufum]
MDSVFGAASTEELNVSVAFHMEVQEHRSEVQFYSSFELGRALMPRPFQFSRSLHRSHLRRETRSQFGSSALKVGTAASIGRRELSFILASQTPIGTPTPIPALAAVDSDEEPPGGAGEATIADVGPGVLLEIGGEVIGVSVFAGDED